MQCVEFASQWIKFKKGMQTPVNTCNVYEAMFFNQWLICSCIPYVQYQVALVSVCLFSLVSKANTMHVIKEVNTSITSLIKLYAKVNYWISFYATTRLSYSFGFSKYITIIISLERKSPISNSILWLNIPAHCMFLRTHGSLPGNRVTHILLPCSKHLLTTCTMHAQKF